MSALHFFYQTRWAIRNDPALGFALSVILAAALDLHFIVRAACIIVRQQMWAVLIAAEHS